MPAGIDFPPVKSDWGEVKGMEFKLLADLMVLFHLLWILFLFFGAFWGVRIRAVRILHLFGLALALYTQLLDRYCPLTHLEVYLRSRQNPAATYSGSFLIYYIEKVVYLEISYVLILIATVFLCGFNLFYYLSYRRKRSIESSSLVWPAKVQ